MEIRSVRHRGLRRLMLRDDASGLPAAAVPKIRNMLSFLQDMPGPEAMASVPSWRAHRLTGERKGSWSLHVTANWRLTFRIEDGAIVELDYEDYH